MKELDKYQLQQRKTVFIGVLLLFFAILLYGFTRLQLLRHEFYTQRSLDNSVRKITVLPVRGLIKDNQGRILVDNRASFSVAVVPKVITDSTLFQLVDILNVDEQEVRAEMRKQFGFRPVIVERDIDYDTVIYLEEHRLEFPGVYTIPESKRYYHEGVNSPHVFGALGEVSLEEQQKQERYESGDMVGKYALERYYDLQLRGFKGARYVRVDAAGRDLGAFDEKRDISSIHGKDINLFMDYNLQQFAESLMVDHRGALVALDARNGGVIALVSKPDYDPRLLTGKIDEETWQKLMNDERHPLYSRSIQSVYPPGSTYKIVAAIAALEEKIVTPSWSVTCPGYFRIGRKVVNCWKAEGHGTVDMLAAIKGSCNVYFYQLGLEIGLDTWAQYSKKFGFGDYTGIDLPNESRGLVPTRSFFDKRYGVNGWTRGNLANLAIGQGELLVTPLQLAQFTMMLANKGVFYEPHIVDYVYDYDSGEKKYVSGPPKNVQGVSEKTYEIVRDGMRRVMEGGTGWAGKVWGLDMAGKTGTAQNPHGDSHAWFMTFAPYDLPEIAVAIIIENGGGGGAVAAPIARKFMEKYFGDRIEPRPVARKKETLAEMPIDSIIAPLNLESVRPINIPVERDN